MKAKDVATLRKLVERLREGRGFLNPDYGIILLDEIERLRALVKDSEWHAGDREHWCQWCGDAYGDMPGVARPKNGHAPTCPAFTPDGVVK